jgi:hypothetical protein
LTPIGDGMVLEMSIKEDESSLRGTVELGDGVYFRVIAVEKNSTKYYSHGDFKYGDPITLHSDFHVRVGDTYDFICFTFNTTSISDLPSASNYVVGDDLPTDFSAHKQKDMFWWRSTSSTEVSSEGVELDITLIPNRAKAKLILDLSYNDWNITGIAGNKVSIGGPKTNISINWSTGGFSSTGSGSVYYCTWSTPTSPYSTQLTSNELTIIPEDVYGYTLIQIRAASISREGNLPTLPTDAISFTFRQPLEIGVNHTILMKLRTPIFARSNIYWDDTEKEMTFEPVADDPAQNDDTKQGYQGLFFKFGSLVGISPAGTDYNTTSTLLYNAGDPTPYTGTAWNSIPKWDATGDITGEPDVSSSKGDICKYINSDYRLPKAGEFGWGTAWDTFGWEKVNTFEDVEADEADGTYDFVDNDNALAMNTSMFDVMFPISGYRDSSNGSKGTTAGNNVYYRTSYGASSTGSCGYANFTNTAPKVSGGNTITRTHAFPIRCIKD